MEYYSTNGRSPSVSLKEAVVRGLAPDRGLYMPQVIERLSDDFFEHIETCSFHKIACRVAEAFFGEDGRHWLLRMSVPGLWPECCVILLHPIWIRQRNRDR